MGGRLLDTLPDRLMEIVDFAHEFYKKEKRAPRIAVDADSWWYTNLKKDIVEAIRERSGKDTNPIERNILFFTLNILQLGLPLHFVFSSPAHATSKTTTKNHPDHDPPSHLLRKTFSLIGIPWHEAPSSSISECVAMENNGLVDAVWSDDNLVSPFAYGCQTLITSFWEVVSSTERAEDRRKSSSSCKVWKVDDFPPGCRRDAFVLEAVLRGEESRLGVLGTEDIMEMADHGLARSLVASSTTAATLMRWTSSELTPYLKAQLPYIALPLPFNFPSFEQVRSILNPLTSTPEALHNIPTPKSPFLNASLEKTLYWHLSDTYQFTTKQYSKYLLPALIVSSILSTYTPPSLPSPGQSPPSTPHAPINPIHTHLRLTADLLLKRNWAAKKAKATFLIASATSLDLSNLGLAGGKGVRELRGNLETMVWILRAGGLNMQRSLMGFLTPVSGSGKGKGKEVEGRSGGSGGGGDAGEGGSGAGVGNGEGGSGSGSGSGGRMRERTPPSPTPASRKRRLPFNSSKRVSKVARTGSDKDPILVDQPDQPDQVGNGKGKEVDIPSTSRANTGAVAPEGSKRVNAQREFILITSDTEPEPELDDEYGSFPSSLNSVSTKILLSSPPVAQVNRNIPPEKDGPREYQSSNPVLDIIGDVSSEDDGYGSFPDLGDVAGLL